MNKEELFFWKEQLHTLQVTDEGIEINRRKIALGKFKESSFIPYKNIKKITYKYVGEGMAAKLTGGFILFETTENEIESIEIQELVGFYEKQDKNSELNYSNLTQNKNAFLFENYAKTQGNLRLEKFLKIIRYRLGINQDEEKQSISDTNLSLTDELEKLNNLKISGVINEEEFTKAKNKLLEK